MFKDTNCKAGLEKVRRIHSEMSLTSWSDPDDRHHRVYGVHVSDSGTSFETELWPRDDAFGREGVPEYICKHCADCDRVGVTHYIRKRMNIEHSKRKIPTWLYAMSNEKDGFITGLYLFGLLHNIAPLQEGYKYKGLQLRKGTTMFQVAVMLDKPYEMLRRLPLTSQALFDTILWADEHKQMNRLAQLARLPDTIFLALRTTVKTAGNKRALGIFIEHCVKTWQIPILHDAVRYDNPHAVRFALKHGDEIDRLKCIGDQELTPLTYALRLFCPEICRVLLKFGARVDEQVSLDLKCFACSNTDVFFYNMMRSRVLEWGKVCFSLAQRGCKISCGRICNHLFAHELHNSHCWGLFQVFVLKAINADFSSVSDEQRAQFEKHAIMHGGQWAAEFLHNCGYRYTTLQNILNDAQLDFSQPECGMASVLELQSKPLSLVNLSANAVRAQLKPNSVYGMIGLGLPSELRRPITAHVTSSTLKDFLGEERDLADSLYDLD